MFVYSLDYARTRLANDNKAAKKGGERQFNGLLDVYKKTIASDGIAGLYRGFTISCVGIIVYRGLYFGMYDSLKPVLLTGTLQVKTLNFQLFLFFIFKIVSVPNKNVYVFIELEVCALFYHGRLCSHDFAVSKISLSLFSHFLYFCALYHGFV